MGVLMLRSEIIMQTKYFVTFRYQYNINNFIENFFIFSIHLYVGIGMLNFVNRNEVDAVGK